MIINRENLKLTLLNNDIFNEFIHNEKELELILNDPGKLKELINNNESFKSKIDNDEKIGKIIKNFLKSNRIELEKI